MTAPPVSCQLFEAIKLGDAAINFRNLIGGTVSAAMLLSADDGISKSAPAPMQDFNNGNFQINRDRAQLGTIKT